MKRNNLIAYVQSFASFLLDSETGNEIDNIVIFGSVAKNVYDEESDIDVFIDTKTDEKKIRKQLVLFEDSHINKIWLNKGIKNPISLHVGVLESSSLKRGILSSGIQIYGKFKQMPKDIEFYLLLVLNFNKLKRNAKVRVWRRLYGYTQRIGKKKYETKGLIREISSVRIEKNVILAPAESKEKIMNFLKKNKIDYKIYEIWTEKTGVYAA